VIPAFIADDSCQRLLLSRFD